MAGKNFDEQLKGEGFECIATFYNCDFVDRLLRQIPDLQEHDFRILPMYIAFGIEMENASSEEMGAHLVYARSREEKES